MDKGIKLQKELAMGIKSAVKEAQGKVGAPAKNPKTSKGMKKGGSCACGGVTKGMK